VPVTGLVLLVAFGATYSLTMLVTTDRITLRPREWVLTRVSGHGYQRRATTPSAPSEILAYGCACSLWFDSAGDLLDHVDEAREELRSEIPQTHMALLLYLVRCPWCASVYLAGPVLWSAWCFGDRAWWFVTAAALTARAVAGTWATLARPGSS
jgi:hypothetical protein